MKQYKGILSNIPSKPILCYDFTNITCYPGSGTSVSDLVKNSNATLVNSPTYSGFTSGSIYFDGTNDFLITSTPLNNFFAGSSPTKSEVTSIFLWVYPMDNGVILSEQGTSPTPNSGWHDAQIEMVGGTLKFGMWNGTFVSSITSSIATPLNNWYYIGMVYNGSTLTAYVNGVSAGSLTFDRNAPYNFGSNLYYGLGVTDSTNMGDGSYAKMYLSRFEVFNYALTQSQITYNYNITKPRFNLVTSGLTIQLDANSTVSYPGSGTAVYDLTNSYTHTLTNAPYTVLSGVKCFDTNGLTSNIRINGTGPTLATSGYTYISWVKLRNDSTTWRTLFRTAPNDHPILVGISTNNLGFYDNDSNTFISSGYDVTPIINKWVQLSVIGDSLSSTFYVNDINVGTIAYGAGGNRHDYWGSIPGQPFGYVANMYLYNRKLSVSEIKQQFIHLSPRFVESAPGPVTNNLVLYYDPSNSSSYSGSGTVINDLSGNGLNGTMSNITHVNPFFIYNGTSSQVTRLDNPLLEPGTGDWTLEIWVNQTNATGSQVILGKFDPGGLTADISYAIRISGGNVRADYSNGSTGVSTANYSLTTGVSYQLVYVFNNVDNNNIITYVNGVQQSTTTHSFANILNTSANLYLGSYNGGEYSQWFNGKIGITRIYNSALTPSQVLQNYNNDYAKYI